MSRKTVIVTVGLKVVAAVMLLSASDGNFKLSPLPSKLDFTVKTVACCKGTPSRSVAVQPYCQDGPVSQVVPYEARACSASILISGTKYSLEWLVRCLGLRSGGHQRLVGVHVVGPVLLTGLGFWSFSLGF